MSQKDSKLRLLKSCYLHNLKISSKNAFLHIFDLSILTLLYIIHLWKKFKNFVLTVYSVRGAIFAEIWRWSEQNQALGNFSNLDAIIIARRERYKILVMAIGKIFPEQMFFDSLPWHRGILNCHYLDRLSRFEYSYFQHYKQYSTYGTCSNNVTTRTSRHCELHGNHRPSRVSVANSSEISSWLIYPII